MPSRRTVLAAAAVVVESAISGCTTQQSSPAGPTWLASSTPSTPATHTGPDRPWVVIVPHPDDETLGAGVLIANRVGVGREVHILLLTRGMGSVARLELNGTRSSRWWGVAHNPAVEGYTPLTPEAFGQARRDELTTAVRALDGGRVHEAGLADGGVEIGQVKDALTALVASIGPGVGVFAPSYVVDDNPDHRAAGQAVRELAAEQPALFGEVGWYILPRYWSDPRLEQVDHYPVAPMNGQVKNRVRNACRAYAAWHPPASYAIGYHSVDDMFSLVDTNPRAKLHR
ncbi:PIG-L deacetylase family protein [Paractinoplanes rhizophilus]|uniref:PIG-L deacetylase family protein n=1 Tax=Paractinoplanes rhizophilus TaxID=1416877 RepID=A0ABW2HN09_9ACTN|nr:PIG-L family deacetylase [Actinoplanes sp.]